MEEPVEHVDHQAGREYEQRRGNPCVSFDERNQEPREREERHDHPEVHRLSIIDQPEEV